LQQSGFVKSPQVSHTKQAEGKRKVANEKDIQRAAEYDFNFISRKQKKHVKMVENSVKKLQDNIMTMMSDLPKKNGNLIGLKTSIKQAQKIHKDINKIFETEWSASTRKVIDDFQDASKMIEKSFSIVGESVTFTGLDKTSMKILGDGMWQDYLNVGTQKRDMVVQAMYDQIIAGGPYSNLINTIQAALQGSLSPAGRPLAQYARLFARDGIMNFSNQVTLKKAEEIGIKHFLYVGNIIATSRKFCKTRAGKVYTKKQIDGWKFKWSGKSGPAYTHRGGYNCRHHWRPVRPEWLEKGVKTKLDIGNWDLETKQPPLPKPKPKKKTPPPAPKKQLTSEEIFNKNRDTLEMNHGIQMKPWIGKRKGLSKEEMIPLQEATNKTISDVRKRFKGLDAWFEEERVAGSFTQLGYSPGDVVIYRDIGIASNRRVSGCAWGNNIQMCQDLGKDTLTIGTGNSAWGHGGVLRHEFGHRATKYDFFAGKKSTKMLRNWDDRKVHIFNDRVDSREVAKVFRKYKNAKPVNQIPTVVSDYASANIKEFFCECFTAFTDPKYKKGMLPKDIEAMFRKLK
jgi:hypothetical protein